MPGEETAGYVPAAPKFNVDDDWKIYQRQLEPFFIAYDVKEDKRKAAILLTAISTDVFRTVTNICFPTEPSAKTFDELCVQLKTHFSPVVSIFAERMRFYDAKQEEHESVTDWSSRLRSLAVTCDFNDHLSTVLKDKFVTGSLKGPILDKIFELEQTVTFAKCVETALKREMTIKQKSQTVEVNKLHAKRSNFPRKNNFSQRSKKPSDDRTSSAASISCYACGKQNHNFKMCRYKSFKVYK